MAEKPADLDSLIPELREWNNGDGISAQGWIECIGNHALAIGYSLIFWPRFVRFERYVLREGFSESALRGFEGQSESNRASVECVMNHLHLADIHLNAEQPTEAQLRYLGKVLRDIHSVKLAADFPNLRFEVEFNDEPGLDPIDYQLSFWQVEPRPAASETLP